MGVFHIGIHSEKRRYIFPPKNVTRLVQAGTDNIGEFVFIPRGKTYRGDKDVTPRCQFIYLRSFISHCRFEACKTRAFVVF
jgi:hypothetical protein